MSWNLKKRRAHAVSWDLKIARFYCLAFFMQEDIMERLRIYKFLVKISCDFKKLETASKKYDKDYKR